VPAPGSLPDPLTPLACDLAEARRYLPAGGPDEQHAFARRHLQARDRLTRLLAFYGRHPCRLARVHLLTASSIVLGRMCGYSESFNALGEAIMPVDRQGSPRTPAWALYAKACAERRPWPVRDELWLEAHARDWQALKRAGLDRAFLAESARHPDDPAWQLLRRHAELTVGARRFDHWALRGRAPHETAIAAAIALSLRRFLRGGWPLVRRYASETFRALLTPRAEPRRPLLGYRRCAAVLLRNLLTAWGAWKVYRRGLRTRTRGTFGHEVDWPLLETVLGERVREVHPLIVRFYRNPGRFQASAALLLHSVPLMAYSRLSALLLGQGLYERALPVIPARLRVFRRDDGSMHFVRELYCGESLRVFDSDFVLREVGGRPCLVEVFGDIGVDVVLDVEPPPGGGVAVVGRDIYWRGLRLPRTGLRVEFTSQVLDDTPGSEAIEIVGRLTLEPQTALGRFVMHSLLRRPRRLGSIHYLLRPDAGGGGGDVRRTDPAGPAFRRARAGG
jgi:hypothetical protein